MNTPQFSTASATPMASGHHPMSQNTRTANLASTTTTQGGLGMSSGGSTSNASAASDCQSNCCSDSRGAITELLNKSKSNARGELTGDICLTLLLDEMMISSAVISETDYVTTVILQSMKAAFSIPLNVHHQLSNEEIDIKDDIADLKYGADALTASKNSADNSDLHFPIRELAKSLKEIKSLKDETLTLQIEESLALFLNYVAKKTLAATNATPLPSSSTVSIKKKNKKNEPITLIVPSYFGMNQRKSLMNASKLVNLDARYIISRGVATVAGNLFHSISSLHKSLQKWILQSSNKELDPLVLAIQIHSHGVDVAVIRCEQTRAVDPKSNLMGYDRLVCIAAGGGHFEQDSELGPNLGVEMKDKEAFIGNLILQQLTLAGITNSDSIAAILFSGKENIKDFTRCLRSNENQLLTSLSQVSIMKATDEDTVRGGALLTAAELESAKHYIEQEDETTAITYAFGIGEDVVNYDVGYRLLTSPSDSNSSPPTLIIRKGSSIHKRYHGPLVKHRPSKTEILTPPLVIEGGSVNLIGSFTPKYPPGYPKLILLQKIPNFNSSKDSNVDEIWTPLMEPVDILKTTSSINFSNNDEDKDKINHIAIKSTITFSIAESTGTLKVENSQEQSAQEKSELRSQIFRVVAFIVLAILLVVGYFAYIEYQKYSTHQQNVQWLTDFYSQHAPQKLQEEEFVEKTLRKYRGKLFLLWRQLEKTYKVKFQPPATILEDVDEEF